MYWFISWRTYIYMHLCEVFLVQKKSTQPSMCKERDFWCPDWGLSVFSINLGDSNGLQKKRLNCISRMTHMRYRACNGSQKIKVVIKTQLNTTPIAVIIGNLHDSSIYTASTTHHIYVVMLLLLMFNFPCKCVERENKKWMIGKSIGIPLSDVNLQGKWQLIMYYFGKPYLLSLTIPVSSVDDLLFRLFSIESSVNVTDREVKA